MKVILVEAGTETMESNQPNDYQLIGQLHNRISIGGLRVHPTYGLVS